MLRMRPPSHEGALLLTAATVARAVTPRPQRHPSPDLATPRPSHALQPDEHQADTDRPAGHQPDIQPTAQPFDAQGALQERDAAMTTTASGRLAVCQSCCPCAWSSSTRRTRSAVTRSVAVTRSSTSSTTMTSGSSAKRSPVPSSTVTSAPTAWKVAGGRRGAAAG